MTRYKLAVSAVALGFTLSAVPAWAGQRPGGEGGGPGGGGGGAGSDSRPGGGGGSAGGGSGGGSGSSGGSSSSTSSDSSSAPSYAPAPSRRESAMERAPQRPGAEQRRGGSGDRPRGGEPTTGRAVPRGTTPTGGSDSTTSSSSEGRDRDRVTSPRERAVPAYSRPREGRTVTGRATERFTPIPDRGRDGRYYYSPYPYGYYYDPYGYYGSYWYPGYALGMGYFYYDPFWYGGYAPYGYQGGYSSGRYSYGEAGALRLKIKPRDAQVFVDGYFVGTVDSFDGLFQRLSIDAGGHKIEIRAPGYETLQFDVLITPGETVTFKGDLERVK